MSTVSARCKLMRHSVGSGKPNVQCSGKCSCGYWWLRDWTLEICSGEGITKSKTMTTPAFSATTRLRKTSCTSSLPAPSVRDAGMPLEYNGQMTLTGSECCMRARPDGLGRCSWKFLQWQLGGSRRRGMINISEEFNLHLILGGADSSRTLSCWFIDQSKSRALTFFQ